MSDDDKIPNISMKKYLRLGFRRVGDDRTGHLQIGGKVVASRIGDVLFEPHEARIDLDEKAAVRLRDRLTQFIEKEA